MNFRFHPGVAGGSAGRAVCDTSRSMYALFPSSLVRAARLWFGALVSPWRERRRPAGTLLVVLVWPLFCVLQLVHWVGFVIDDLLFRGWRRVDVRDALFVLGPPRSGTTHLHHVLSLDERTTTFRLWECLFGLSVTARYVLLALGRADHALGRPFGRLGGWLGRRWLSSMDDVHPFSLTAPEEDFLALTPVMQCFILAVVFPRAPWLWRTARLDREYTPQQRARLMAFYRDMVRKHVYVFGSGRRFLSKNASFSGMAEALLDTFPDARIIACDRSPLKTVPSQLSSIRPGLAAAGFEDVPDHLKQRLMDLLAFYYRHLREVVERFPDRLVFVDNERLRDDLAASVTDALTRLDRPLSPQFAHALAEADSGSRGFRSAHRYTLAEFGLDEAIIAERFAGLGGMPGAARGGGQ